MYLLAYQIKAQEAELLSAKQAWFNQLVKATKQVGKKTKSAYKDFEDFYNSEQEFNSIFTTKKKFTKKVLSSAEVERLLSKEGG